MTHAEYNPFPERELKLLIAHYDEIGAKVRPGNLREYLTRQSAMLNDALAAHLALRERFLEQSMTVRRLEAERSTEDAA